MPITPALYSPWQFWDGRADSLWAQALGPVENPLEHDFSRGEVFDLVRTRYLAEYEATFGPLPAFRAGRASPLGENAAQLRWKRLGASRQGAVNTVLVNVGKAIAAFERRQTVPRTRFDRYVRWLSAGRKGPSPLNREAVAGLKLFIGKGRCATCHSGPMLTNNEFANTGVPDPRRDRGRQLGLGQALRDPFNCRGVFNDALRTNCDELDFAPVGGPEAVGAFKVPSLRGVAQRAPYMHAGQFVSLDGVLRHYESAPVAQVGKSQLRPVSFTPPDRRALIAFLQSLDP
jgi:cytochrome c peroxidase